MWEKCRSRKKDGPRTSSNSPSRAVAKRRSNSRRRFAFCPIHCLTNLRQRDGRNSCSMLAHRTGTRHHRHMPNNTHSQADKPCIHHISRRGALARGATAVAGVVLAPGLLAAPDKRKVVVWSEGTASVDPESKSVYPKDINFAIAE